MNWACSKHMGPDKCTQTFGVRHTFTEFGFITLLRNVGEYTRWFIYDRDDLCVNKSQFVPVIFEPSCISDCMALHLQRTIHCIKDDTSLMKGRYYF
jgi:hypothetical protein